MKTDLRTFVSGIERLPSLPTVYYELVRAVGRSDSHIDEIAAIIRRDPSLTSRLLRIANSIFYGFPSEVTTLEEAVQLIGLSEIQDLVLVTSVIRAFDSVPSRLVDVASFWKHSVVCAIASALLAEHRRAPDSDRFFVGGLLHDIGWLVLFLSAPQESTQILQRCEAQGALTLEVENEVLGFDHAMVGAELIAMWELPRALGQMVGFHHNPGAASQAKEDVFTIHYADFIATALEFGKSGEFLPSPLQVPPGCEAFLVVDHKLEDLVMDLDKKCGQLFPFLV
jgi:HD-like signal output (HDOD) protein